MFKSYYVRQEEKAATRNLKSWMTKEKELIKQMRKARKAVKQ